MNDPISEESRKKLEKKRREEEEEKLREINYELKLKDFFQKIQILKKVNEEKFNNGIDKLIYEQIYGSDFESNKRIENRINHFKGKLNDYVLQKKNFRKIKENSLIYKNPCEFGTLDKSQDNSF